MPNLTIGAICPHNKLEPRRRRAVRKVQHHTAILIPLCLFHPLAPNNLVLWNSSQQDLPDCPAIDLRSITALAELKHLLALMVVEKMDRRVTSARVLSKFLKDTSFSHGALTTAEMQIKTSSMWRDVTMTAFVDNIVKALPLQDGSKSQSGGTASNDSDSWSHGWVCKTWMISDGTGPTAGRMMQATLPRKTQLCFFSLIEACCSGNPQTTPQDSGTTELRISRRAGCGVNADGVEDRPTAEATKTRFDISTYSNCWHRRNESAFCVGVQNSASSHSGPGINHGLVRVCSSIYWYEL